MALRKKQKLFVEYYLQLLNATQAAIKAGYSVRSAASIGGENLKKPEIMAEIRERLNEVCMESDEILAALSEIGRANIDEIVDIDKNGRRLNLNFKKAKQAGKLHLIKSVVPTAYGTRVELHDRMKALELLGKYQKLFTDKVEQSGEITLIIKRVDE